MLTSRSVVKNKEVCENVCGSVPGIQVLCEYPRSSSSLCSTIDFATKYTQLHTPE